MQKVYLVHINAKNDNNGNPRRGWLCYNAAGDYYGFVDEGYAGRGAVKEAFPEHKGEFVELVNNIPVSVGYYRDLKKFDAFITFVEKKSY